MKIDLIAMILVASQAQEIVEVTNELTFYNSSTNEEMDKVTLYTMSGYQTISNYESNITLSSNSTMKEGYTQMQLCYVENQVSNYQAFLKDCKEAYDHNDTTWILASNYGEDKDKNLIVLKEVSNFSESAVEGLILISDKYPHANDSDRDVRY